MGDGEIRKESTHVLDELDGIVVDGKIDNGSVTSNVEDGVEVLKRKKEGDGKVSSRVKSNDLPRSQSGRRNQKEEDSPFSDTDESLTVLSTRARASVSFRNLAESGSSAKALAEPSSRGAFPPLGEARVSLNESLKM